MRPYKPADDEPVRPARGGGLMPGYSLAFVCVLGLLAGGGAALALHYAGQGAPEVHDAGRKSTDAGREGDTRAETVADGRVPAVTPAQDAETSGAGGEVEDMSRDEVAASPLRVRKPREGSGGAEENGRGDRRPRAVRSYVRASRGGTASGGRGVAGHTVRGVKKTGEVIGKTFGKIGGVFHD